MNINLSNKKIGILGGSFNPAHVGHLYISSEIIDSLKLDLVLWLVSPHNPLKNKDDLLDYKERFGSAKEIASLNKKIIVLDYELKNNLKYTYQTLLHIKNAYPSASFCWLMGADCLAQFDKWQNWQEIYNLVPVVVFKRRGFAVSSLKNEASMFFKKHRKNLREFNKNFAQKHNQKVAQELPLCFSANTRLINVSATEIRNKNYHKKNASF